MHLGRVHIVVVAHAAELAVVTVHYHRHEEGVDEVLLRATRSRSVYGEDEYLS